MAELGTPLIEILQGADEYFPALISEIDRAQHAIYLESYLIHDDPPTNEVLAALVRAAKRGLRVHVVLDGFGAAGAMAWVGQRLDTSGVEVELYRPGVRWLAPKTWRRIHRKLVMIDERVGFIGGINLIGDRFDLVHGDLKSPRLDFAVRVSSARVINAMSRVMRRLWWRTSLRNSLRGSLKRLLESERRAEELIRVRQAWRSTRRHLRWRGPPARKYVSRRSRLLLRDNLRHRRSIESWYLWKIRFAKRDVLIANAYFVPTYRFRQALIEAAGRGVRVRLLLQGNSDQWWTHWATQALIGELVAAGIEIYEYTESFLHAKVAVIDDAMTVGSSNIDPFSLMLSLEANLVADDASATAQLREKLEAAISISAKREPLVVRRGPLRGLARAAAITFSLMALRIFIAFSGTGFRIR
ncbi:phospholipase D-like domain-containing protein [beta proteobacterium MWH-UniP1]